MKIGRIPTLVLYLGAKNDRNGNPRRCFAVLDQDASPIEVIDEGYAGFAALWPRGYESLPRTERILTTPAEYRLLLKLYPSPPKSDEGIVRKDLLFSIRNNLPLLSETELDELLVAVDAQRARGIGNADPETEHRLRSVEAKADACDELLDLVERYGDEIVNDEEIVDVHGGTF
jgi:hypothetical protein